MTNPSDNPALPDNAAAPDSFIDKWLVRWPEWSVAQVFIPPLQRGTWLAWAALQQELTDAAWGGGDARPGEAKLGWWQEELEGWSRGVRRHPLGQVLQGLPGDWLSLARMLPALRDGREQPTDAAHAWRQVEAVAQAFARVDVMLQNGSAQVSQVPAAGSVAPVSLQLLHARLLAAGEMAVPLQELARAGQGDATRTWARHLAQRSAQNAPGVAGSLRDVAPDAQAGLSRFRRVMAALAHQRLRQGDATRPLPAWRALLVAWRAARN